MHAMDTPKICVDREQERRLFRQMLAGEASAHILLIQAEGGMGKTELMKTFWTECEPLQGASPARARLNFRDASLSAVGVVLAELCNQLGATRFERFHAEADAYAKAAGIHIEQSTLYASQIDATLGKLDPEQRQMRRLMLTDAFFSDLVRTHAGTPSVLLLDTFEAAPEEVQEWLAGPFLGRVRPHRWLVVVVAGRRSPAVDIDWEDWRMHHTLQPLNREHIGEYLRRVELSLSEHDVNLIYELTDGNPLELVTAVKRLLIKRASHRS
jgi:hypothetical protein